MARKGPLVKIQKKNIITCVMVCVMVGMVVSNNMLRLQPLQLDANGRFGRTEKAGTPLLRLHMTYNSTSTQPELMQWAKSKLDSEPFITMPPVCPIFFNDKYKIIFLKIPKTGGSTLATYFTMCKDAKPQEFCLKHLDTGNFSEVKHIQQQWNDYFVFSFTRNVFARTVSQYLYLTSFHTPGCPVAAWDDFCQRPHILGDICRHHSCCSQSPEHQYLHVIPQSNCLLTSDGKFTTDFLGRTERLEEDLADIVSRLNKRPGVPLLPPPFKHKQANANQSPCSSGRKLLYTVGDGILNYCNKEDYFRGKHLSCYNAVKRNFANDFGNV
jgi:hypothetical protein